MRITSDMPINERFLAVVALMAKDRGNYLKIRPHSDGDYILFFYFWDEEDECRNCITVEKREPKELMQLYFWFYNQAEHLTDELYNVLYPPRG